MRIFFFGGGGGHYKRWQDDTADARPKSAYQEKNRVPPPLPIGSIIPCENLSSLARTRII